MSTVLAEPLVDVMSLPSVLIPKKMRLPNISAVYFVIDSGGIVHYVGRALTLKQRWANHHRISDIEAIDGARLAWMEVDPDRLDDVEARFIAALRPPLNQIFPRAVTPNERETGDTFTFEFNGRVYMGGVEAANAAQMSRQAFSLHVKTGAIVPAMRVGSRNLYAADDVVRFCEERRSRRAKAHQKRSK